MACTTVATVSVAAPVAQLGESRVLSLYGAVVAATSPSRPSLNLVCTKSRVVMSAAPKQKEVNMAGLTGVALLAAAAIVPEIAEAAAPGVSPSLKNLLLSVVAGGVVAAVIGIAVAGVSTFDPVKRR